MTARGFCKINIMDGTSDVLADHRGIGIDDMDVNEDETLFLMCGACRAKSCWTIDAEKKKLDLIDLKNVVGVSFIQNDDVALFLLGDTGEMVFWNLKKNKIENSIKGDNKPATAFKVSPDKKTAFIAHKDGTIALWDLKKGKSLDTIKNRPEEDKTSPGLCVKKFFFLENGGFACLNTNNTITVYRKK